jgi:phenylalanyl-tRNA synthetase alpha subunit
MRWEQIKATYLGRNGRVTELLKGLAKLPPDERKTAGAAINRSKDARRSGAQRASRGAAGKWLWPRDSPKRRSM